jgi:membrane protein implicated in regulation of membrane protease activity
VSPSPWHWWILAAVLLAVEALTPGFVFLWLGLSAALTGLARLAAPGLGWEGQLVVFTALALASVAAWFALYRRRAPAGDPDLNRRAQACVGQVAVLDTPLVTGRHARVRLRDTTWMAAGPELPAGTPVRIVGARGTVLLVEPAPPGVGATP